MRLAILGTIATIVFSALMCLPGFAKDAVQHNSEVLLSGKDRSVACNQQAAEQAYAAGRLVGSPTF